MDAELELYTHSRVREGSSQRTITYAAALTILKEVIDQNVQLKQELGSIKLQSPHVLMDTYLRNEPKNAKLLNMKRKDLLALSRKQLMNAYNSVRNRLRKQEEIYITVLAELRITQKQLSLHKTRLKYLEHVIETKLRKSVE
jgi:hypothetical protein